MRRSWPEEPAQRKRGGRMNNGDSYVCMFCSGEIRETEATTTVPDLGILVHSSCYRRETASDAARRSRQDRTAA